MATVAVMHQETKSWLWTLASIGMLLVISILTGAGVYHLAAAFGLG
jgi:ferrous iron transport protein B